MDEKYSGRYDDIIDMPHHVSRKHKATPRQRPGGAVQSFLSPYRTFGSHRRDPPGRHSAGWIWTRTPREELDRKLQTIMNRPGDIAEVKITYFRPDSRKSGGEYVTVSGKVSRLDTRRRRIIMADGREIPVDDIMDMTL